MTYINLKIVPFGRYTHKSSSLPNVQITKWPITECPVTKRPY